MMSNGDPYNPPSDPPPDEPPTDEPPTDEPPSDPPPSDPPPPPPPDEPWNAPGVPPHTDDSVRAGYRDLIPQEAWTSAEWLDYYTNDSYVPANAIPGGYYVPQPENANPLKFFSDLLKGTGQFGKVGQLAGMAGIASVLNKITGGNAPTGFAGYKGGIPTLAATREMQPIPQTVVNAKGETVPRRPGSGGITYFTPMVYTPSTSAIAPAPTPPTPTPPTPTPAPTPPTAPTEPPTFVPTPQPPVDPTIRVAQGGILGLASGGRLLRGPGDGVSDSIPAQFTNGRPARLADGEFVFDARTVSEIGNGSTEAGARKLYALLDQIHKARRQADRGKPSHADKYLRKLV